MKQLLLFFFNLQDKAYQTKIKGYRNISKSDSIPSQNYICLVHT